MLRFLLFGSAVLLGCGGSTPATGTSATGTAAAVGNPAAVQVVLTRPYTVGERFELEKRLIEDMSRRLIVNSQVAQQETKTTELFLDATVHVLEVSAVGKAKVRDYTIRRCTTAVNQGPSTALIPPGSVIRVTSVPVEEGDGVIRLEGGQLTEDQTELFDKLVSTTLSDVTDDQVFGSPTPRSIHESWPANTDLMANELNRRGSIDMTGATLSGQVHLIDIMEREQGQAMRVRAEVSATGIQFTGLPPGSVTEAGTAEIRLESVMPVDPAGRSEQTVRTMDMASRIRLNVDGRSGVLEMRFQSRGESAKRGL